jgi:hypothetical protein
VVNHQPLVILAGAFDNTDPSVFSTVTPTSLCNKGVGACIGGLTDHVLVLTLYIATWILSTLTLHQN